MAPPSMSPTPGPRDAPRPRNSLDSKAESSYRRRYLQQQQQQRRSGSRHQRRPQEELSDATSGPVSDDTESQLSSRTAGSECDAAPRRESTEAESESEEVDAPSEAGGRLRMLIPPVAMEQTSDGRLSVDDEMDQRQDSPQTESPPSPIHPSAAAFTASSYTAEEVEMQTVENGDDEMQWQTAQHSEHELAVQREIATEYEQEDEEMTQAPMEEPFAVASDEEKLLVQETVSEEEIQASADACIHSGDIADDVEMTAIAETERLQVTGKQTDVSVWEIKKEKRTTRRSSCKSALLLAAGIAVVSVAGGIAVCQVYPTSSAAIALGLATERSKEALHLLVMTGQDIAKLHLEQLEAGVRAVWLAILEHETLQKAATAVSSLKYADLDTWRGLTEETKNTAITTCTELLKYARERLQLDLVALVDTLMQTVDWVMSCWEKAFTSIDLKAVEVVDLSSEQYLAPLTSDQEVMRRVRDQLMTQEAAALQELKRFKKRRASVAIATDAILADTRTEVMESIYEVKLAATQHIEQYTEKLTDAFMQSIEQELGDYERMSRIVEEEGGAELLEEVGGSEEQLDAVASLKQDLVRHGKSVDVERGLPVPEEHEASEYVADEVCAAEEKECLATQLTERLRAEGEQIEEEDAARAEAERVAAIEDLAELEEAVLEAERVKAQVEELARAEREEQEQLVQEREQEEARTRAVAEEEEQKRLKEEAANEIRAAEEQERLASQHAERLRAERKQLEEGEAARAEAERIAAVEELVELEKAVLEAEQIKAQVKELARVEREEQEVLALERAQEEARARVLAEEKEKERLKAEQLQAEEDLHAAAQEVARKLEAERVEALRKHEEAQELARLQQQEEERVRAEEELRLLAEEEDMRLKEERQQHVEAELAEAARVEKQQATAERERMEEAEMARESRAAKSAAVAKAALSEVGVGDVGPGWRQSLGLPSAAVPSRTLVQISVLFVVFLAFAGLAAWLVVRRRKRGLVGNPPRRRKRWQRPAEAEEVVLLSADSTEDGATAGAVGSIEPEPEVVEFMSGGGEETLAAASSEGEDDEGEELSSEYDEDEEYKEEFYYEEEELEEGDLEETSMSGLESDDSVARTGFHAAEFHTTGFRATGFQTTRYEDDAHPASPASPHADASPVDKTGFRLVQTSVGAAAVNEPTNTPSGASAEETPDTAQRARRRRRESRT
ncbi:hypothetical protein BBJ28_00017879 [Nothophytophthora sp. Chile5]|nr:hypothetical protein BBJ28_00017879 [Nothophytophthora sp. Chile5]